MGTTTEAPTPLTKALGEAELPAGDDDLSPNESSNPQAMYQMYQMYHGTYHALDSTWYVDFGRFFNVLGAQMDGVPLVPLDSNPSRWWSSINAGEPLNPRGEIRAWGGTLPSFSGGLAPAGVVVPGFRLGAPTLNLLNPAALPEGSVLAPTRSRVLNPRATLGVLA